MTSLMRDTQQIELRLLSSAMRPHQAYATAIAESVTEFVFDAQTRQNVWQVLGAHYHSTTTPPPIEVLRSRLKFSDSLTEVECSPPYTTDELPDAAEQLLWLRGKRSLVSLEKQIAVALGKHDIQQASKLFDQLQ